MERANLKFSCGVDLVSVQRAKFVSINLLTYNLFITKRNRSARNGYYHLWMAKDISKDPLLAWSTSLSKGQASVLFREAMLTLDRCSKESLCNAGERVFDRWVDVLEQLYDRFLAAF